MPLSKARNKERMRKSRLHKRTSLSVESKPVQPKAIESPFFGGAGYNPSEVDADGNPMPEI